MVVFIDFIEILVVPGSALESQSENMYYKCFKAYTQLSSKYNTVKTLTFYNLHFANVAVDHNITRRRFNYLFHYKSKQNSTCV
jgi:hypothetical protein